MFSSKKCSRAYRNLVTARWHHVLVGVAFNAPNRFVHAVEAPETTLQEALDWTWRYANIVHQGDPWIKTGLRSAMVGDVFLVKGEAHAVMMMGLAIRVPARWDALVFRGRQITPLIILPDEPPTLPEESIAEPRKERRDYHERCPP